MASIYEYRTAAGERRYRVIYRDGDRKQRQKRGFTTVRDAKLFVASVTTDINQGSYVAPSLGRALIKDLAPDWLATKTTLKPSSYRSLDTSLRIHVLPRWGNNQIKNIRTAAVKVWVAELSEQRSATIVIRALEVLRGILDHAIDDGLIKINPCHKVDNLPRKKRKPNIYLTHEQVFALAHVSKYPALVLTLAYTGIRWGEATGLRVKDINFDKQRLLLENNAVKVGSTIIEGTLKSHKKRSVPFPAFLEPWLQVSVAGKGLERYVFGAGTEPLKKHWSDHDWWTVAVKKSQIPRVTPHDLRHTAASLSVAAGANVKAVQKMLGHASAAMTLDVYADLFDDDLDVVSAALDHAVSKSNVAKLLPIPDSKQKKTG